MSIHSINWRSAEREGVVSQYTVLTGDRPNGRVLQVNSRNRKSSGRNAIVCRNWRSAVLSCKLSVLYKHDLPSITEKR